MEQDEQIEIALLEAKKMKLSDTGAKVVTITATNEESPDETNIMKIMSTPGWPSIPYQASFVIYSGTNKF